MKKLPRFLPELGAIVLLAVGLALLLPAGPKPHHSTGGAPSASARAEAAPATAATLAPTTAPLPAGALPAAAPTSAPPSPSAVSTEVPSGVPAVGDGPAGDVAVQAAFARLHPSDLSAADTEALVALGRDVWLAETTGAGRTRWPQYFSLGPAASAPYLYSGVRIQAVAAHSATSAPDRARVDLLWVGTSP
ncbi:hypothetical protein ACFW1A_23800, partial [Kitasatospora sp. NPDC058965]|uniref:hypothetical protein n=1 Tax=Kitasatospora sp. NPDC058965 TaxID=3346682 RepID=UPI0036A539EA